VPIVPERRGFIHKSPSLIADRVAEAGLNEVARQTRVSRAALSQWLNGLRSMPWEKIQRVAGAVDIKAECKITLRPGRTRPNSE
jgi:transcriptional regulator with XRE-family HTH domain